MGILKHRRKLPSSEQKHTTHRRDVTRPYELIVNSLALNADYIEIWVNSASLFARLHKLRT